ncbi:MAG: VOC family protein [Treponema sp.]|jgi:hypothetical protein|nr:VOC family protein [Treponema sp.]
MEKLGSGTIIKIGFVVHHIETVMEEYAKIFGINPVPKVEMHLFDEKEQKPNTWQKFRGKDCAVNVKVAFIDLEPIFLEFLEPIDETPTPWREHLEKHGNSVCFMSFYVNGFQQNIDFMDKQGYPLLFSQEKGYERYAYFDTLENLGITLEIKERNEGVTGH